MKQEYYYIAFFLGILIAIEAVALYSIENFTKGGTKCPSCRSRNTLSR